MESGAQGGVERREFDAEHGTGRLGIDRVVLLEDAKHVTG